MPTDVHFFHVGNISYKVVHNFTADVGRKAYKVRITCPEFARQLHHNDRFETFQFSMNYKSEIDGPGIRMSRPDSAVTSVIFMSFDINSIVSYLLVRYKCGYRVYTLSLRKKADADTGKKFMGYTDRCEPFVEAIR